ncbi:MAG: AI-2E family transporter, partial [Halodesulfurarchaeum sp.]
MQPSRRQVLGSLFVLSLVVAGFVLHQVLWTAVFGVTVAYVLLPVHRRLVEGGLSRWWAAVGTTVFGTVVVLIPVVIASVLLYRRRGPVLEFIVSLPESVEIAAFGFSYAIETETLLRAGVLAATGVAVEVARALPTLGLKLTLFGFVVFGLLLGHESVESAVLAAIPQAYRHLVGALAARARDTLYSIYVLQVVTGAVTFVIAIPVFWVLGYPIPYTLAFLSGVLQFLPIVGPSILI